MGNLIVKLIRRLYRFAFIRYLLCGCVATAIDFSILYTLTEFGGIWYIYSAIIAFIIASSTNFQLNRKFTFRNTNKNITRQYALFISFAAIGLMMNIGIIYSLVELFDFWYMLAKVVATLTVVTFNYSLNKKITFAN